MKKICYNLFATGLVAGGALAGVLVAILSSIPNVKKALTGVSAEHGLSAPGFLGIEGYKWLGVAFFALMGIVLYRIAISKRKPVDL